MSIKLEIPRYDRSALRRFGEALIDIATDRELARAEEMAGITAEIAEKAAACVEYNHIPAPPPAAVPTPPAEYVLAEEVTLDNGTLGLVAVELPPAPTPPLAPPAPAGPGPQLDTAGIPWDARIHASSKTTCKDGTWKLKPGMMVSDETRAVVVAVIAELKGVQALPVPAPPTLTVVPAPPPAPAAPAGCPPDFASFIKEITGRITLGQLTPDQVNATCQTLGLDKCNLLAGRPDLIPAVWAALP